VSASYVPVSPLNPEAEAICSSTAGSNVIFVNSSVTTGGSGTYTDPYQFIANAQYDLETNASIDTVCLKGAFNENINFSNVLSSEINIIGHGLVSRLGAGSLNFIEGSSSTLQDLRILNLNLRGYMFLEGYNVVTIEDLEVNAAGVNTGIYVYGVESFTVDNVLVYDSMDEGIKVNHVIEFTGNDLEFYGNAYFGLEFDFMDMVRLTNSYFHDMGRGVALHDVGTYEGVNNEYTGLIDGIIMTNVNLADIQLLKASTLSRDAIDASYVTTLNLISTDVSDSMWGLDINDSGTVFVSGAITTNSYGMVNADFTDNLSVVNSSADQVSYAYSVDTVDSLSLSDIYASNVTAYFANLELVSNFYAQNLNVSNSTNGLRIVDSGSINMNIVDLDTMIGDGIYLENLDSFDLSNLNARGINSWVIDAYNITTVDISTVDIDSSNSKAMSFASIDDLLVSDSEIGSIDAGVYLSTGNLNARFERNIFDGETLAASPALVVDSLAGELKLTNNIFKAYETALNLNVNTLNMIHNTFYYLDYVFADLTVATGAILNNIFSTNVSIFDTYSLGTLTSDYNLFDTPTIATGLNFISWQGLGYGINSFQSVPGISEMNPFIPGGDHHLVAASAAIDTGTVTTITTDIDGELRDSTPDIGADERL